ncbi:Transmembrane protein 71 [Merluccius polli]|uniref:Transmembrane protein 71 n=1 Tax=Merluccius polli TaxID=89951 RepID=A0AA47NA64_MERPO|nr:Transmembrane protein 71 [Merluccius polli]
MSFVSPPLQTEKKKWTSSSSCAPDHHGSVFLQGRHNLDLSLLSDDCSFSCYSSNPAGGSPCSCRRSRRLLTNGYYVLGEDSVSWDDEGNISLTPSKTNVSYKENLVRVFRRKKRSRRSLASLLSGVTETCQTWLDEKVFGGVFTNDAADADADAEPTRLDFSTPEPDSAFTFTYDHSEILSPPEKEAPAPQTLFLEEICTETCHSQEQFTQSLCGLSEVLPPPLVFHSNSCCSSPGEQTGSSTMKSLLSFIFTIFICTYFLSWSLLWAGAAAALVALMAFMFFIKTGPVGSWRRAKTEVS